jgi:cyanophycin synthetase
MSEPPRLPRTAALAREAAARLGYEFRVLDPEYGHLFEVAHGSRGRLMIGGMSPLNDAVASRLAADKFYTARLLERAGIRVPATERCLAPGYFSAELYEERAGPEPGLEFARHHGYPVVVKPIRGSSGRHVALAGDPDELIAALEPAWERHGLAVIQEPIPAPDLRLDFLDGEYLLGYERAPIRVTGDGRSTIRELVAQADRRFASDAAWQGKRSRSWPTDEELEPESVLPAGELLDLGGTLLNLNSWASGRLIPELPQPWLEHGLKAGAALGLRHFGIDFRGAGLDEPPEAAAIVEINSSPLLLQIHALGWADEAVDAQARILRVALED